MSNTRDGVFERLQVDHAVRGVTLVSWELRRTFRDPTPWEFQLEVNRSGDVRAAVNVNSTASSSSGALVLDDDTDWLPVGLPAENSFYALDDTRRLYGKDIQLAYRVVLTTPNGRYVSRAAHAVGLVSDRQQRLAREMIRRRLLDSRGLAEFDGFLLKRKLAGQPCTRCLQPDTGGVTDSDCPICYGVGIVGGYWRAAPRRMLDLSPQRTNTRVHAPRGTVDDTALRGRFAGFPLLHARDVWVDKFSGRRYFISEVQHAAEIGQTPIVVDATLKMAQFSHPIYLVEIDESDVIQLAPPAEPAAPTPTPITPLPPTQPLEPDESAPPTTPIITPVAPSAPGTPVTVSAPTVAPTPPAPTAQTYTVTVTDADGAVRLLRVVTGMAPFATTVTPL